MDDTVEQRIRERAYEIWLREGRPPGRDQDHWAAAEAEIAAEEIVQSPISAAAPAAGAAPAQSKTPVRSRRVAAKKPELSMTETTEPRTANGRRPRAGEPPAS